MKKGLVLAAMGAAMLVAACGGGGGGAGAGRTLDSPTAANTVGFWDGTTSNGLELTAVVFGDGSAWAIYAGGGGFGLVQGAINGAAKDFNFTTGTITDVTLAATATAKSRINGSISTPGSAVTFSGAYDSDFELAPSLTAAAGTYTGLGPSAGTNVTLAASGAITGATGACTFTGTAIPRTDANIFNVTLTFGAAPCALPGVTVTGIANYDPSEKGLLAAGLNASRTAGTIFMGTKP
jgi:hypothetical protein